MNIETQFSNYNLPTKRKRKDTNRNMVNFAANLQDIQTEELSELKGQLGGKELTLGQLNVALNEDNFNCGPNSTCSCGKGMNKGQFLALLFEKVLKLDNPEKIEINK